MSPRAPSLPPARLFRALVLALAAWSQVAAQTAAAPDPARQRVEAPVAVHLVQPRHPDELRQKLVNGEAVLECVVGTDGRPADIKTVSESHPGFAAAAEEALRQWEFKPGSIDGVVAPVRVRLPFEFRLSAEQVLGVVAKRPVFEEVQETVIPARELPAWPRPLQFYTPRYPPELEGSGKYGKAVVNITINQEGQVINPRIVKSTYPEFNLPALLTAVQLRFPPQVMADNRKIYVNMDIQFDFKVPGRSSRSADSGKKK